ncbi:helix-turn-helix transcriptional regulator [Rhizobium fabae]|uniref:AraC-like DNA-binding protein n=1 Tax=Rhizobium fabae TaxID=573179 RepID=A0A7W6BJJ5_9HYPH|nr:AraC family transcriptional regulator [Rhizobium fabae]MBB3919485.1 AraC-like DNA-binding protein [Rhizobium fabae]RUM06280.1 helix-turn-helix domain-containing protein [Rhizobium fabae]
MVSDGGIHHHAHGEWREPSLSHRTIRFQKGIYADFHHLFLLQAGTAALLFEPEEQRSLQGPALAYLPPQERCELRMAAGAAGFLIGASPQIMVDAIGDQAESYALRTFSERPWLTDEPKPHAVEETQPLVAGFVRELGDPSRASWMVISAYLRLILMALWRTGGSEAAEQRGRGGGASILQRYRQLVEIWFRQHRPISDYARELGVTTDRLHSICSSALGRSPVQLLHERVVQEAKLRLERSARTVQEISDSLGFRDPTYFSHFFKRKTGFSPATYRDFARKAEVARSDMLSSGYSDWP